MTSEKESLPRRYSEEEEAAFLERATELQRAGIGGGVALGTALGSGALAVALPAVVVGGSYAAARWIYAFQVETRRERLATLVDQLGERVERIGGVSGGESEIR